MIERRAKNRGPRQRFFFWGGKVFRCAVVIYVAFILVFSYLTFKHEQKAQEIERAFERR